MCDFAFSELLKINDLGNTVANFTISRFSKKIRRSAKLPAFAEKQI